MDRAWRNYHGRGNKIWYCGEDSKHQYGVAFIVRKEVLGSIISCTSMSSRRISIRISTVGVRYGCLLSAIVFKLFIEKIMLETLHDHRTAISIGGRPICNLQFANNIDLMGGSSDEFQDLTNRLIDRTTAYGVELVTEES